MPIAIGKLTLQAGQVTFSDRSIQPAYSAELSDLNGRITGLSSVAGTTADVDVHGAINRSGALVIAGKVNPLAKEIALDVQVGLKDIELPPASPYTGKYAGYVIDKGKLDLALAYKIADRKLERAEQAGAGPVHVRRQGRQPRRGEAAGAPGGRAAQGSARRDRH